jgi:hypothetical protein
MRRGVIQQMATMPTVSPIAAKGFAPITSATTRMARMKTDTHQAERS